MEQGKDGRKNGRKEGSERVTAQGRGHMDKGMGGRGGGGGAAVLGRRCPRRLTLVVPLLNAQ